MAEIKEPAVIFSASGWKQFLQFLGRDNEDDMVNALMVDHTNRQGFMTGRLANDTPNVEEIPRKKPQRHTQRTVDCIIAILKSSGQLKLKNIVDELDFKYDIHWNRGNPNGPMSTVMKNCPNIQKVPGKLGYYHYVGGELDHADQPKHLTTV